MARGAAGEAARDGAMTLAVGILTDLLIGLFVLAQFRFALLILAVRRVRAAPVPPSADLPMVAIQVATYREARILPSLLKSIHALEWPLDRLVVQILDDSSGADAEATQAAIAGNSKPGLAIEYLNRGHRSGYKAGALNHGIAAARGVDFIAYFDADCRPRPQFLLRTTGALAQPDVAAVQARWEFPNALASPLTALQAAAFEYLFRYEYETRSQLGLPAYYLGSAAVWKRQVIEDLGGWKEEPLTAEDVDIGYRAAAAGWRIVWEPDALADDDALEDLLAFRAQQRRWTRAVLQASFDAVPGVRGRKRTPWASLMEWTTIVPHSTILLTLLLGLAMSIGRAGTDRRSHYAEWLLTGLFIAPPAVIALILAVRGYHPGDWRRRVKLLALAGPYAAATMTSFLFGIWDFLSRRKVEFVATPKAGQVAVLKGSPKSWLKAQLPPLAFDWASSALLVAATVSSCLSGDWSRVVPTFILALAYGPNAVLTAWNVRARWAAMSRAAAPSEPGS